MFAGLTAAVGNFRQAAILVGASTLLASGLMFGAPGATNAATPGQVELAAPYCVSGGLIDWNSPRLHAQAGYGWNKQRIIIEARLWWYDFSRGRWIDISRADQTVDPSAPFLAYNVYADQYVGIGVPHWNTFPPRLGVALTRGTYTIAYNVWWMNGSTVTGFGTYGTGSCRFV